VPGGQHRLHDFLQRRVQRQGDHVQARNHHLAHGCFVELEDGVDHLLLFVLDDAFLLAGVNQGHDLLLGHVAPLGLDAQQAHNAIAQDTGQVGERPQETHQEGHRAGEVRGQALGAGGADGRRDLPAGDQHRPRADDQDDQLGQDQGRRTVHPQPGQPQRQARSQPDRGQPGGKKAQNHNAQLVDIDQGGSIRADGQGQRRAAPPGGSHLRQGGLAGVDQRVIAQGQQGVAQKHDHQNC